MAARLALLLLLLTAGCTSPEPQVIRFGLAGAPANLDPRFATDAYSERINRLLYRGLVRLDPQGLPLPGIASWQRLAPRHYRFRLGDEGRRFSDGSRLVAADVVATYQSLLDPAAGSPHRATLAPIERVEALDPDTVDFQLVRADPLFPALLTLGIVPAAAIASGHPLARAPIGSGPLRLVAWPEEERLRLERLRDGQQIELVRVRDPSVRVMKLLNGEVDLLQNDLPPELVEYLKKRDEISLDQSIGSNFSYIGFNLEDPLTGRLEVRRAIAHALDRDAIIRHLFRGAARPAEALLPPEHWAGATGLAGYRHDPARARALLRAAGLGDGVRLVYKTSSDPFRLRLATLIQSQLAAVGIEVELKSYDWGTFYGDIKSGRFQLYSLAWVGVRIPDIFRYVFHSASLPPDGANRGRYRSAAADRLIEAAIAAPALDEQARLYRALQALLHRELPYLPLWYEDQVVASSRRLSGYRVGADGNYDGLEQVVLKRAE